MYWLMKFCSDLMASWVSLAAINLICGWVYMGAYGCNYPSSFLCVYLECPVGRLGLSFVSHNFLFLLTTTSFCLGEKGRDDFFFYHWMLFSPETLPSTHIHTHTPIKKNPDIYWFSLSFKRTLLKLIWVVWDKAKIYLVFLYFLVSASC